MADVVFDEHYREFRKKQETAYRKGGFLCPKCSQYRVKPRDVKCPKCEFL